MRWFHLDTLREEAACNGQGDDGGRVTLEAPLDHIPVLARGGSIVPRKMRLRRSSKLMFYDPYTLIIAPDANDEAIGELYLDDEASLAHETKGKFALRQFSYRRGVLSCSGNGDYAAPNVIERIVIAGMAKVPTRVVLSQANVALADLVFFHDAANKVVTLKKPDVRADQDWTITFVF